MESKFKSHKHKRAKTDNGSKPLRIMRMKFEFAHAYQVSLSRSEQYDKITTFSRKIIHVRGPRDKGRDILVEVCGVTILVQYKTYVRQNVGLSYVYMLETIVQRGNNLLIEIRMGRFDAGVLVRVLSQVFSGCILGS
ncbi:hypothetical protein F8M41_003692 [Gigaspora margarita]|uniref:Uncharacterized protein n=1 Tax=Gigaspora margarita TaxID=4874 RepID=A0A8H3XCF5_GIGMA|nr:hypothetical protein F8M41_003692 [Gigaspora margarita]